MPDRDYQMTASPLIAARMRGAQTEAQATREMPLPPDMRQIGGTERTARLAGLAEGCLGSFAAERQFERQLADLRQTGVGELAFRQSLWTLMRAHQVPGPSRVELMRRALAWYRARRLVEGKGGSPWAKSLVAVSAAQAGRWEP